MSIFSEHKQVESMIAGEAKRLDFSPVMLNDLSCILFDKPHQKLTLRQAKRFLIELQTMDDEMLHHDSPLAKWQNKTP